MFDRLRAAFGGDAAGADAPLPAPHEFKRGQNVLIRLGADGEDGSEVHRAKILRFQKKNAGLVTLNVQGFGMLPDVPLAQLEPLPFIADPTEVWEAMKDSQRVLPAALPAVDSPKREGHVRFVCISDTHGKHRGTRVPDGDVLLHAGDFTNVGEPSQVEDLAAWLGELPHAHKIVIAGNHDLTFQPDWYRKNWSRFNREEYDAEATKAAFIASSSCTYLEDSGCEVFGLKVWGSPWQPEFCDWAFNADRGPECLEKWRLIPSDTDVLLTHGPPLGHGDLCTTFQRAGCYDLLREIQTRIHPIAHVFGHIHEGFGATTDGATTYVNASSVDFRYRNRACGGAIVFDVPLPSQPPSQLVSQ